MLGRVTSPIPSRWLLGSGDAQASASEIPAAALAAAPPGVAAGGRLLPREPTDGRCRLCGRVTSLSREHLPPRSAANSERVVADSIEEWVRRQSLDERTRGTVEQGGVWGRTLCSDCNSVTGHRYGDQYRGWAGRAARLFRDELPPVEELDRDRVSRLLRVQFSGVRPGSFARQVLSLMASLSGPWDLASHHPEIRAMVLDGTAGRLPEGMFLGMAFYAGPSIVVAGPTLVINRITKEWRWSLVLAYPPLAFEFVLAAAAETWPTPMCGIGNFLETAPGARGDVELECFIAFGHTGWPTDWRTRAQIENGLTLKGTPEA